MRRNAELAADDALPTTGTRYRHRQRYETKQATKQPGKTRLIIDTKLKYRYLEYKKQQHEVSYQLRKFCYPAAGIGSSR